MNPIYDNWDMWQKLLTILENQFGNKTELILHDLTKDYNHTIVDIRNGYITNRKIGDCGSNLGLEVLRGTVKDGDRYNYIVNTRDGKILRSSTMYLYDDNGTVIGSLCINTDITETVHFEEYLRQYNQYNLPPVPAASPVPPYTAAPAAGESAAAAANPAPVRTAVSSTRPAAGTVSPACETAPAAGASTSEIPIGPEIFANDVSQILDFLIEEAGKQVGKPVGQMNREDKIRFVRYLDQKGAFLITKASERVYEHLNISRYTLYNYLDLIHKEANNAAQTSNSAD